MGAPPISNQIRRLRFEADEMTQKALAEAAGVTRQTIVAIENAKFKLSSSRLCRSSASGTVKHF